MGLSLTLNDGTSFSGRTKLNLNEAGSALSTLSFLSRTATSEAKTHADLSSASPLYLSWFEKIPYKLGVGNQPTASSVVNTYLKYEYYLAGNVTQGEY